MTIIQRIRIRSQLTTAMDVAKKQNDASNGENVNASLLALKTIQSNLTNLHQDKGPFSFLIRLIDTKFFLPKITAEMNRLEELAGKIQAVANPILKQEPSPLEHCRNHFKRCLNERSEAIKLIVPMIFEAEKIPAFKKSNHLKTALQALEKFQEFTNDSGKKLAEEQDDQLTNEVFNNNYAKAGDQAWANCARSLKDLIPIVEKKLQKGQLNPFRKMTQILDTIPAFRL